MLLLANRYRAVRIIGKGGFGRTFLAIDEFKPSKPACVIKQFLPRADDEYGLQKATELFAQEAVRLDDLGKHGQIPELLAYFTQEERQYLVQEFIDGDNLLKELSQKGVFNETQIRELLKDLLSVLKFVHENYVIHRDIKPENIIRRRKDSKLVLVDFGAAKSGELDPSITGTIIGSAAYIAPEQARGKTQFSSDLYSLGVTCIHLLTKVLPLQLFDHAEGEWIWRKHLQNNSISEELGTVLDKLIEQATKKRYQSVDEVLEDLNANARQFQVAQTAIAVGTHPQTQHFKSDPTIVGANQKTIAKQETVANPTRQESQEKNGQKSVGGLKTFEFDLVKLIESKGSADWGGLKNFEKSTTRIEAKYVHLNLGNGITLDLVPIRGGTFTMGSPETEEERTTDEGPQHTVKIKPFFLSKYPITQKQWQVVMNNNPAKFADFEDSLRSRPVERVSWFECVQFCEKLSTKIGRQFRLPSEAEWEYGCRAGTTTPFYFGNTILSDLANYNGKFSYGRGAKGEYRQQTTEVGIFPPNAFGLYDMHGNVWEWCADSWHDNYQDAPQDGIPWIESNSKQAKVLRGGSWLYVPGCCRSAYRLNSLPNNKSDAFGFRIACF
jgi:formylglycine-generating enzyme required for sulfatase activity